jgi:dTMP kinase
MISAPTQPGPCTRGPLVSVEGINGVGKTYLTNRAIAHLDDKPALLEGLSERKSGQALDKALLAALRQASGGDPFLRGGTPTAESLLLLAIKRHDLDTVIADLAAGRTVIEGRSTDTTAVCQGLLRHPGDPDAALATALDLLQFGAAWRPQPDLTILVTDDAHIAAERVYQRDRRTLTDDQRAFMHAARQLHEQLADHDRTRYRVIDRRLLDEHQAAEQIRTLLLQARDGLPCVREPWQRAGAPCLYCGRPTPGAPA